MSGRQGVLHNLSMLAVGQVASQLLNVWALVFLADRLGPHWYGVVQVGVAFMAYACVIAEWGLFSLGIRETSRLDDPDQVLTYARHHTGLISLQALVVVGGGLLVLPLLPFTAADPWVFRLYLGAVLLQVFMLSWVATGIERMVWVGVTKTMRSLLYAVLILVLLEPLSRGTGISAARWVPIIFLAANLGGNLVIGGALRHHFGRWILPLLPPPAEAGRRWRETGPLGASIVVLRILLNVDLIVLGILATPATAGNYAAASRVIFLLVVAVEVLWAALLPRLSRLAKFDRRVFRDTFNSFLGFVLAGLLPVAVGGYLVGADIMALLYRDQYPDGGPVFRVLAVSYACLATATFLGTTLVAEDRQREYFGPLAIGATVAIVGTVTLVPGHGAFGASLGMLAAHTLLVSILVWKQRHLFSRSLGAFLLQLLPALGIMALAVGLTPTWPVLARIAVGGGIYGAAAGWPLWRSFRRARAAGSS